MPFRDAHHVTGRIVAAAEAKGVELDALPLAEMQGIEPRITAAIFDVLSPENSVASRVSYGGTAPQNVAEMAQAWLKRLEKLDCGSKRSGVSTKKTRKSAACATLSSSGLWSLRLRCC